MYVRLHHWHAVLENIIHDNMILIWSWTEAGCKAGEGQVAKGRA